MTDMPSTVLPVSPLRLASAAAVVALGAVVVSAPALAAGTEAQKTWHADQAMVVDARSEGRNGEGVIVAVLDSWIDRDHPDFEGRVLAGADCLGGTCVPGPTSSDQCDHGTHVSGTVAASSFGVATRATVLPVRVLAYDPSSADCVGRPQDVAAGIRWAVDNGARVINLSLGPDVPGLSTSSSIPAAVQQAADAGVVVVFSAGNASLPVADAYGGSAVIVAATAPDGTLASYSQRGAGVDLAAPGGDPRDEEACTQADCVTSLFPAGRYSVAAGTSMAAPHVSGIAALLLAQDPTRTREQVIDRLLNTARPLAQAGSGLVDARAALAVQTTSTSSPVPAPAVPSPADTPAAPPVTPAPAVVPVPASPQAGPVAAAPTVEPTPSALESPPPTVIRALPAPVALPPLADSSSQRLPGEVVGLAVLLLLGATTGVGVSLARRPAGRHG